VEALRHAARATDWGLFGRLFVDQGAPLLVSADRMAIGQVLEEVPPARFADSPEMALCAAGLLFHQGRIEEMRAHLDQVAALVERAGEDSVGAHIALRLLLAGPARSRGDLATLLSTSKEALELVSGPGALLPAAAAYRSVALGNLGSGLLWSGRPDEAERRLREGLTTADGTQLEAARINMWGHLGLLMAASGRLHEAFGHAQRAVDLVEARGWAPLPQASAAYLALALVNLRWNRVDDAVAALEQGQHEAGFDLIPLCALAFAQATLHASEGRPDTAREELHRLRRELDGWEPAANLARWGVLTEAEIDLADGRHVDALHKLRALEANGGLLAEEKVCLARALLGGGWVNAADAVLLELRDGQRTGVDVEVWILSALVADRLREDNRALDALTHAVELARGEDVRRPFMILAPEQVRRLLGHLQQVDPGADTFVRELVADLTHDERTTTPETLTENLTDRELSILRYLPSMMTNEEIAGELFVSVNTVKAHLKRIYRKLGVVSRREAVRRAHDLGMIRA
jgi:LuxR family maltose regulon positive regulatory protein